MTGPAFERYLVTLELRGPLRLHFNHGAVLMGLLCQALRAHPLPAGVLPFAPESGRARFETGDLYRFGVTLAGEAREHARALKAGLTRVGLEAPAPAVALGGNFTLRAFEHLPDVDVVAEAARLADAVGGADTCALTLQFTSPLRLERPEQQRIKGAAFLNADCFPAPHFLDRLYRRLHRLDLGRYPPAGDEPAAGHPARAGTQDARLTWLDQPITGAGRVDRAGGYTLGGVQGQVRLVDVPAAWLPCLVAGQYLHAGENTHYGLGRYRILEAGLEEPFQPATTAFASLADEAALRQALAHLLTRSRAAGVDRVTPQAFDDDRDANIQRLVDDLRGDQYQPSALVGLLARKRQRERGLRALVVPTVRDRLVQRVAAERWGPAIDTLLEDCAYAYRKGFSRNGAARAIQRAYEAGYKYVLDADVRAFFDEVPWPRLEAKLAALFPFEPLVALAMRFMRASVVFEGRTLERQRGLPQGAPLSPLLANLYLDELDEELLGRDYRLVRYGDDFVVLARDLDRARQARDDARRALARLGLALHEGKTDVRAMDDGLRYLGYLFCRSVVLESPASKAQPTPGDPAAVPAASWLAQVPLQRVHELVARPRAGGGAQVEVAPLAGEDSTATAEARDLGAALHVITPNTRLWLKGETLMVAPPDTEPRPVPLGALSHVVLVGSARLTVPALLRLGQRGVPVYFCRRSGELYATHLPHAPAWDLWLAQARAADDADMCLAFAREIVRAKLGNTAYLMARHGLAVDAQVLVDMRVLARACDDKASVEELRGLEGRGAALYFNALREHLGAEWGFTGRRVRPAPDPVNALLSFGYTLLYHHISTALVAAGLNPRLGLFHRERGVYHALACDLQEELRYKVDSLVLALVHRREVQVSDFAPSPDGRWPCLMTHELRRRFVAAFEQRLVANLTTPSGATLSYRAWMDAQARAVRALVRDGGPPYRAWRAGA